RRLVEEEDAGPVDEREPKVETTLHPARVGRDLPVRRERQPDAFEQLVGARAPLRTRKAVHRRLEAEVLAAGQERVERRFLARGADRGAHLWALTDDVEAADASCAGGRRQQ